jgi:hypothetical protein
LPPRRRHAAGAPLPLPRCGRLRHCADAAVALPLLPSRCCCCRRPCAAAVAAPAAAVVFVLLPLPPLLFKLIVDYCLSPCHHWPLPLPPPSPFIFIVVAVAFIIAVSVAVAAAAFSWLLIVVFPPAIAVSIGVFVTTTTAATLPLPPLSPQCHEEELWQFLVKTRHLGCIALCDISLVDIYGCDTLPAIHSLRVGWRNFFSSCAVVSVFGSGVK